MYLKLLVALVLLAPILHLDARGHGFEGREGGGWNHSSYDPHDYGNRQDWQRNEEERNLMNYGEAANEDWNNEDSNDNDNNDLEDNGDYADDLYDQDVQQMEQGQQQQQQPENININVNEDQGGN